MPAANAPPPCCPPFCRPQLLNAKPENVERESEIVAQSGRRGAVTIATNMAGRGTDILLGGNPGEAARPARRQPLMGASCQLCAVCPRLLPAAAQTWLACIPLPSCPQSSWRA